MKVANYREAAALLADMDLYGMAYVDENGCRVNPLKVIIAPDGTSALDSGGRVYRPAPLDWATEEVKKPQ